MTLLAVDDLSAGYDPEVPVLRGVSLTVAAGEVVALLGPNGAGKSTLVKAAAGLVPLFGGRVRLDGEDIAGVAPHRLARRGLGFVPQTENVFASLSVRDNLAIAADRLPRAERARRVEAVAALFPDLLRAPGLLARRLSGGQRQMLAIARALVGEPRVLLLDEPSAGLSPKVAGEVFATLGRIRDAGVAVLLVEQNARAALRLADRALVLVAGCIAHAGAAHALRDDPALGALYLGARAPAAAA